MAIAPASAALIILNANAASAHDFGRNSDFFTYLLEGAGVVLNDVPLLLAAFALGFVASLWNRNGYPQMAPFLLAGVIIGFFMPLQSLTRPEFFSLGAAIAAGLAGAAAKFPGINVLRALFAFAGLLLAAGALGGHEAGTVPFGVYPGIVFMAMLAISSAAVIASLAKDKLPAGMASVAIRAGSSWIVAMAVMMLALAARQPIL